MGRWRDRVTGVKAVKLLCIAYSECLQVGVWVFSAALAENRALGHGSIRQLSDPEVVQHCSLLQVANICRFHLH
jgi:hypothetical protein